MLSTWISLAYDPIISHVSAILLLLRHHVVPQRPDSADLYLDGVAGDHVAVGALGSHPDDVAALEGVARSGGVLGIQYFHAGIDGGFQ